MSEREEVLKKILSLPEEDRRWLVEEVAPTLPALEDDFELTTEELTELRRRLAEHETDPESGIPWEQVKAQVLARLHP